MTLAGNTDTMVNILNMLPKFVSDKVAAYVMRRLVRGDEIVLEMPHAEIIRECADIYLAGGDATLLIPAQINGIEGVVSVTFALAQRAATVSSHT